jgi:methyl-accepting chemotaxis protein
VAAASSAIVLLGLTVSGLIAWREADARILSLQLEQASTRLSDNLSLAHSLFDQRFPGPWHLVPSTSESSLELYNGNGRVEAYRTTERLPGDLYKGETRILGNPAVERALLEMDSLTGMEMTIAQRIAPRPSTDPTVGDAPAGRALRLVTTVTRVDSAGVKRRATLTIMPTRNPKTGKSTGAGAAFETGRTYEGRAMVAGQDRWTRYEPVVDPAGAVAGIFYGGILFQPFATRASEASWALAQVGLAAGFLGVLAVSVALYFLTRRLLHPLSDIRVAAARLSAGEQGVRTAIERVDEIGDLSRAFDLMAARLEELHWRTLDAANRVETSSRQVDYAAAAAAEATRQVADAAGGVSSGSSELTNKVVEVSGEVDQTGRHVDAICAKVADALGEARAADQLAVDGHHQVGQALEESEGVRGTVGRAKGIIVELDSQADQIDSILEAIRGISYQTNLLALNAAIEAARAGSAGLGFGVVAEEVRKLSQEAENASGRIAKLIVAIKERIGGAAALMVQADRETEKSADQVRASDGAFRQIRGTITRLNQQISGINQAADGVAGAMGRVREAIEGVASFAEESAAASEEMAALAQEQTATLSSISSEVRGVSSLASELKQTVTDRTVVGTGAG